MNDFCYTLKDINYVFFNIIDGQVANWRLILTL